MYKRAALGVALSSLVLLATGVDVAAQPAGQAPPAGGQTPAGETPPSGEPTAGEAAEPAPAAGTGEPSAETDEVGTESEGVPPETAAGQEGGLIGASERRSLVEEDVEPSITVVRTGDVDVRAGGLVQVHAAPYVGDEALIENGDPATRAGFRLRRARLGFEGRFRDPLRIYLAIDLLDVDGGLGTVSDAKISYEFKPWLYVSVGTGTVPFSRGSLESSRSLITIERPLSVQEIGPDDRLGVTVEGHLMDDRLGYVAGVMNGTEGYKEGNQYGGILGGARLQYVLFGEPDGLGVDSGAVVGASALYEDAPSTDGFAVAGDVLVAIARAQMSAEVLCDRRTPDESPDISPTLADEIERCGAYLNLSYELPTMPLEPAARVEIFDDNRAVEDAGDVFILSGGVNSQLVERYVRAQLHYVRRVERHGPPRENDALVLSVQGVF